MLKELKKYSQPKFYRFDESSIKLAEYAASKSILTQGSSVADLCCGSGVVGIEFAYRFGKELNFTFVDKQKEFEKHLVSNCYNAELEHYKLVINDFFLANLGKFDLILVNPPFFSVDKTGKLPANLQRRECRFWKYDWFQFFDFMLLHLTEVGEVYFIARGISDKFNSWLIKNKMEGEIFSIDNLTQIYHFKR